MSARNAGGGGRGLPPPRERAGHFSSRVDGAVRRAFSRCANLVHDGRVVRVLFAPTLVHPPVDCSHTRHPPAPYPPVLWLLPLLTVTNRRVDYTNIHSCLFVWLRRVRPAENFSAR